MSERYLYGDDNQFVGSMDDDGRIYDDRHGLMGYIRDGTVYDNCNLPMGRITDSGMVVDNFQQEVGQEYGTGFCAPGVRRQMGLVRAGTLSEGRGRDYGAFHLLSRKRQHGDDLYGDGNDDYEEYDSDSDEDYDGGYDDPRSNDWNDLETTPRRKGKGGNQTPNVDEPLFGCLAVLIGFGVLFLMIYIGLSQ